MAPNNALRAKSKEELEALARMMPEMPGSSPARRSRRLAAKATTSASATAAAAAAGVSSESSVVGTDTIRARGTGVHSEVDDFIANPNSELRCFFTGLMFITRLPCPGWCDHHPGYLMRAMAWFPLLGTLVGLWCAAFVDAGAMLWTPTVAAAMSTSASIWMTGCFHEDGLGDTVDGFGGGWTKKQIMTIMKDSRVGTFGAMGLILHTVTKVELLGHLGSSTWAWGACGGQGPALVLAHTIGRATAAPLLYCNAYVVDEDDAKSDFYGWFGRSQDLLSFSRVLAATLSAVAVTVLLYGPTVLSAVTIAMLASSIEVSSAYARRVLGGIMGDYLGATICLVELATYCVLAADVGRLQMAAAESDWETALRPVGMLALAIFIPYGWATLGVASVAKPAVEC